MVVLCICSCTSEYNIFDNYNSKLLNFTVSVPSWKNNDSNSNVSTRATPISGTSLDKSSSFNIIADAYDGKSSYSTIIKNEAVSFTNNMWQTTAPHYWPGNANNTLNFYAYYPNTISSSITHTAGSAPTLSYTVPDDAASQIDIMTATSNNVNGSTNSSTPLTFSHIFAAVQFSIGSAGMLNGTITGITLNNILYKGTYSLNGTWTQDQTSKNSFSQKVSASTNAGTAITSGVMTFMMMPQTLGSDANITVTYSNGGTLTKSISGTWNAGNAYTYNISKTISETFDYSGNIQSYTVPLTGTYKLEVWGAQGGTGSTSLNPALGGYSLGNVHLIQGSVIYICVGGAGSSYSSSTAGGGGYNGGANGGVGKGIYNGGCGGGGATNICTSNRGTLNNYSSYKSEILIVAGGGGGREGQGKSSEDYGGAGGAGGGAIGNSGLNSSSVGPEGGNQTTGYSFGIGQIGYDGYYNNSGRAEGSGGGGGGLYGGFSAFSYGGAGGSGYIDNLSNSSMQNGVRSGNGYARITFVSAN